MNTPHDHARPDIADMRAALGTARAILLGDDEGAHAAASAGSCPACTTAAGISLMVAIIATMAGETLGMSPELARHILAGVDATEAELRAAGN